MPSGGLSAALRRAVRAERCSWQALAAAWALVSALAAEAARVAVFFQAVSAFRWNGPSFLAAHVA